MNKLTIVWGCVLIILATTACNQSNEKTDTGRSKQIAKPKPAPQPVRTKPTSYADTLFILDDFASQPFQLDSVSVLAVKQLLNAKKVIKKPIVNQFIEEQTDTLITIRKAHSYIQLYTVNSEENKCFYKAAIIQDSLPVFSQPLQIGQTKQQVKRALTSLSRHSSIPDIIQISNSEETDYVYLVFRNNKLASLKFQPYLD